MNVTKLNRENSLNSSAAFTKSNKHHTPQKKNNNNNGTLRASVPPHHAAKPKRNEREGIISPKNLIVEVSTDIINHFIAFSFFLAHPSKL